MKKVFRYNILFCIGVAALFCAIWFCMPAPTGHPLADNINDIKLDEATSKSIDLLGEMNKYLTAIAFGIIAILGNILLGETRLNYQASRLTGTLFFAAMILALCSIFFGFLTYTKLFENISNNIFDVGDARVTYGLYGQFYTLLAATLLFIWYIINTYFNAIKKDL